MRAIVIAALAASVAACSGGGPVDEVSNGVLPHGPQTNITEVSAGDLPPGLDAVVQQAVPGMTIAEAERKEREGRVYYDIEGTRPDGSEVELDVLQEAGGWRLVEIQRDLAWKDVPAAAAAAGKPPFVPERVIESIQTDGSVIYELFAPGRKDEPAMEVRVKDGKAEVLATRWAH